MNTSINISDTSKNLLYGTISATTSLFAVYPIDIIKTQYQIMSNNSPKKVRLGGIINNIYTKRGIPGFYKGFLSASITYPPFWGFYFYFSKHSEMFELTDYKYINKAIGSFSSGFLASSINNPFFVIRQRMQTDILKNKNTNYYNTIKNLRNEGILSFYSGWLYTQLNVLKLCIQFPADDYLKEKLDKDTNLSDFNSRLISSSIAKCTSSYIFYPLEYLRTLARDENKINSNKKSIISNIKNIYHIKGILGLYKGVGIYTLWSTPNYVVMRVFMDFLSRNF